MVLHSAMSDFSKLLLLGLIVMAAIADECHGMRPHSKEKGNRGNEKDVPHTDDKPKEKNAGRSETTGKLKKSIGLMVSTLAVAAPLLASFGGIPAVSARPLATTELIYSSNHYPGPSRPIEWAVPKPSVLPNAVVGGKMSKGRPSVKNQKNYDENCEKVMTEIENDYKNVMHGRWEEEAKMTEIKNDYKDVANGRWEEEAELAKFGITSQPHSRAVLLNNQKDETVHQKRMEAEEELAKLGISTQQHSRVVLLNQSKTNQRND